MRRLKKTQLVNWTPFDGPTPTLAPQPPPRAESFDDGLLIGVFVGVVVAQFLQWALWRGFDNFFGQE